MSEYIYDKWMKKRRETGICETCGQKLEEHQTCEMCGILVGLNHLEPKTHNLFDKNICGCCYGYEVRQ